MTDSGCAVFDSAPWEERPGLIALLPGSARRLCHVGCGNGAAGAAFRGSSPTARVTGIERDAGAAAAARLCLDRVLEEDAAAALRRLARDGERFDAFLFGGALERLEDPVGALALARAVASPAAHLVASVRNVGYFPRVRELVAGRFDPVGLDDTGPLRWFDRRFLVDALEEAGWRVARVEGVPTAATSEAESFLSQFAAWPGLDRNSLTTSRWVALAVAGNR